MKRHRSSQLSTASHRTAGLINFSERMIIWVSFAANLAIVRDDTSVCSEYDAVTRLGIPDAKSYLHKRFAQLYFLDSVCVGRSLLEQLKDHAEEVLNNNEWSDVTVSKIDDVTIGH